MTFRIHRDSTDLIYSVDEHSFNERVVEASRRQPILADFWAEWCPPCLALTPVLELVVAEYGGDLALAKIEVDDNMRLAGHYRLRGFPTVILFEDGEERGRFSGARPKPAVRLFLRQHLKRHTDTATS